jgi:hypothetical protein
VLFDTPFGCLSIYTYLWKHFQLEAYLEAFPAEEIDGGVEETFRNEHY